MRKSLLISLIALLLVSPCIVQAQETEWKILGVSVEGNVRTDAGLIIATSGLVIGDQLNGEKVQSATRSLWALNLFGDIKIAVEQESAGGVFLIISVVELPRLEFVDISGGKELDKEEVEKACNLTKGQILLPADPVRIRTKIEDLAAQKGFLLAKVEVKVEDGQSTETKRLVVKIDEGKKVKIDEIIFTGNSAFKSKKLKGKMNETHESGWFRSGEFNQDKFQADLDTLADFYRINGYRDAAVRQDTIIVADDKKTLTLKIIVDEGPKYYFGKVSFLGDTLFSAEVLANQIQFKEGDAYDSRAFNETVSGRIGSLYSDRGYINAQVEPRVSIRGGDTLDVNFVLQSGNRFSVRQIIINGNTKTHEKVIRRELSLKPGSTFDVSKLKRSARDLQILNYFADIKPDIEQVGDDKIDVFLKVEEKPTDQINFSAGYSEQDGLIGSVGFKMPNLLGTGQSFGLDWNFGTRYYSFSVNYTQPWLLDTETLLGGSLYDIRRRWTDGFTETVLGGSIQFGRRFKWPDDYFRGDWTIRRESSTYTEVDTYNQAHPSSPLTADHPRYLNSITQSLTRDSRDSPEFPTTGSVLNLTSELAGGPLTGDDQYHKHVLSLEWYSPITPKLVLYTECLSGYLAGLRGKPSDIPLLKYFYMGGAGLAVGTGLRGYDDRTVGPPGSSGLAQGGKSELKFSSELRVQVVNNPTIYALAFAEAGNVWMTPRDMSPFDLKRSFGFGVRLYMPMIGLIGLDYGAGLDYYDASGRTKVQWMPHFQFGRSF